MQPEDFARAAGVLRAGAAQAAVPGFPGGLGAGMAALAGLAAGCTRLFLARPPLAPGAVICGASHSPAPGVQAHAAGLGPTPQAAFARAMGEVAEARALYRQPDDPRLAPDGTLPLLDHRLHPMGRIPAQGLLREAGEDSRSAGPDAAQRAEESTGAGHTGTMPMQRADASLISGADTRRAGSGALREDGGPASSPTAAQRETISDAGRTRSGALQQDEDPVSSPAAAQRQEAPVSGLGAGSDAAMAARAAWHEAVERHAIALWFHDGAPAAALPPPPAAQAVERALRRGAAAPALRYLLLPGAAPGLIVVAALSEGPWGCVPGYGCAPTAAEAACKAATEAAMGEFALHLEARAQAEQGLAPPSGGFTARAALLAARPDLLAPAGGPPPPGPDLAPQFADLTLPGEGVTVLRVLLPGLRQPGGSPGPV